MKRIKSFFCILLAFSLIISNVVFISAHENEEKIVTQLIVTPKFKLEIKQSIMSNGGNIISSLPKACSHTFTNWATLKSWYEDPPTFGLCYVLVKDEYRYCTKCNLMQARNVKKQLEHSWKSDSMYEKTCLTCGKTTSIVR